MSEATIVIGAVPNYLEKSARDVFSKVRIAVPKTPVANQTEINVFNLGTLAFFTEHVEKLEGLSPGEGCIKSQFKNLPWYMLSIWVPAEFTPPAEPVNHDGWPLFVGSVQGLLNDLLVLQKIDRAIAFGEIPAGYEKMRADCRQFLRSDFSLDDERALLQWVWRGLYDSALLAGQAAFITLDSQ
jgi:hypothetical protein